MSPHIRQLVNDVVAALLFGLALALAMPQAYAGMISADGEEQERARVKTMLERPQLATELERMGIPAQEASARVDAMTPGEVRELAGRLDALAAGGQTGTRDLLLVLLVVLLVLLLI